jgi:SH3 domain protein
MYISDRVVVSLRAGKGSEFKSLAVLKSDQVVEVTEEGEGDWTGVRTEDGKTGYIPTRFLQEEKTCRLLTSGLPGDTRKNQERLTVLEAENTALKAENESLKIEMEKESQGIRRLALSLPGIEPGRYDLVSIKTALDAMGEEHARLKEELASREGARRKIKIYMEGFLAGAGVLLFGVFVGINLKGRRQRSSLLG